MASHGAPSVMDQVRKAGVLGPGMMPPFAAAAGVAAAGAIPKLAGMAKAAAGVAGPYVAQAGMTAAGLPPWVSVPAAILLGRGRSGKAAPTTAAAPSPGMTTSQAAGVKPPVLARGLPTSQAQPVSRPRATLAPKPAAAPASTAAPAAPPPQPPGSPVAPGAPLSGPTSQSAPSPQTGAPAAPSSGPRPHPEGGVWSPQRIQNELGIQARRQQVTLSKAQADEAATLVSQGRTPADAVAQVATKANTPLLARPKLSAAETKVYARLIGQGKTDAEATQILEQQRLLVGQLGTPSSETVRQSVARRNNTGRWEPPKADEAAKLEASRRVTPTRQLDPTPNSAVTQSPKAADSLSDMPASEIVRRMATLRESQPRPIDKMFGRNGPTPEQAAAHGEQVRAFNREMSKLKRAHKIALERDNANFYAKRDAQRTKK